MPYWGSPEKVPFISATEQIIVAWQEAATEVGSWTVETLIAEKRRAISAFRDFFILAYPVLRSKNKVPEWEEWLKSVDLEAMKPIDLQMKFIEFCADLIKYNVIPAKLKKMIPKGGMTLESLEGGEGEDGEI